MNRDNIYKILYYTSTGLLSGMMLMSASMYFFKYQEMAVPAFTGLGYPIYIIYPLAIAKILGLIAIWTNKSKFLKNLAYAGFFYNFLLAFSAHLAVMDNEFLPAVMALVLLTGSYIGDIKTGK